MNEQTYVLAAKVDALFAGDERIAVEINVSIGRDLSQSEEWYFREYCGKMVDELHKNTVLLDPQRELDIEQEKSCLLNCFAEPIYAKQVRNEYTNSPIAFPWYEVTTNIGRIIIGWRKRVISIDWTGSDIEQSADELFPKEDVTKSGKLIHAWGYYKATEYISTLLAALNTNNKISNNG